MKVDTICGISVDGVIGNAAITSGLICLIACATASLPDILSRIAILDSLLHCDCTEAADALADTAAFAVV